jgi:hypothetical protein
VKKTNFSTRSFHLQNNVIASPTGRRNRNVVQFWLMRLLRRFAPRNDMLIYPRNYYVASLLVMTCTHNNKKLTFGINYAKVILCLQRWKILYTLLSSNLTNIYQIIFLYFCFWVSVFGTQLKHALYKSDVLANV